MTDRAAANAGTAVTVIRPSSGLSAAKARLAWGRRDLLLFFAVRDLKVRYAQTALGVAWTILQPLGLAAIFTLAFRKIGRVETAGVAYPVFALSGLTLWTFVARSLSAGAESLVANAHLVTKTAVPRLLIPLAAMASTLFDLAITFAFLLLFAAAYGELPGLALLTVPVVVALALVFVCGPVYLLAALNVRFRDIRHILPFFVLAWLFVSPVAYPTDTLGAPWQTVLALNPLVPLLETFRWAVIGTPLPTPLEAGLGTAVAATLLAVGLWHFGRAERAFADIA